MVSRKGESVEDNDESAFPAICSSSLKEELQAKLYLARGSDRVCNG